MYLSVNLVGFARLQKMSDILRVYVFRVRVVIVRLRVSIGYVCENIENTLLRVSDLILFVIRVILYRVCIRKTGIRYCVFERYDLLWSDY